MNTTPTTLNASLTSRLIAAAAAAVTTFVLFASVVSLGDAKTPRTSVQIADAATPVAR